MPRIDHAALAATLSLGALSLPALAQSYRLVELPTLGSNSVARDINDAGVIVGSSRRLGSALDRPVVWENGQIADLDAQNWYGTGSAATIDNAGRIAVSVNQPLNCVPAGVMLIVSRGTGQSVWFPEAASATPSVIGSDDSVFGFLGNASTLQTTAAAWNGAWQSCNAPLGTLSSEIAAGNSFGKLVGWRLGSGPSAQYASASMARAVVTDGAQTIELAPAPGRTMSAAAGINSTGVIVGSGFSTNAVCVPQVRLNGLPVVWTKSDQPTTLPMPGRNTMGSALDINDRGEVIGQVFGDSSQGGPVVWRGGQAFTLLSRAQAGHRFVRLDSINAINASGQIVGSGTVRTPEGIIRFSAFVATPCYADFDGAGGVTTSDLFGFLNAFFTSDRRADIVGAPVVNNEDLFGFLNAWFSGC